MVLRCGLHWKAWAARKAASRAGRRPPVYNHSSARTKQGGGPVYVERNVGPVCMERQVGPEYSGRNVVGPVCMEEQVYSERNVQAVHDGETVTSARSEVSEN